MKFRMFFLVFTILFISCKKEIKKGKNKIIVVTYNDTIFSKNKIINFNKYEFFGYKSDKSLLIKSNLTSKQNLGKFAFGLLEKKNPKNKIISYIKKENPFLPDFNDKKKIDKFCLIDEFIKTFNENDLTYKYQGIDEYTDDRDVNHYVITFFIFKKENQVGIQRTNFTITEDNILFSANFLAENEDNIEELKQAILKLTNQLKI